MQYPSDRYSVTQLQNGYTRVYDRACQWASLYAVNTRQGIAFVQGQADKPEYRQAILDALYAQAR